MPKKSFDIPNGSTVTENTASNMVLISEEKIENILLKHLARVGKQAQWITPVTLSVSICITFATTEFNKDFLNIEADAWKIAFMFTLIASVIWSVVAVLFALKNRKTSTVSFLVEQFYKNRLNKD